MSNNNISNERFFLSHLEDDILLLGSEKIAEIESMIKEKYVTTHHVNKIFYHEKKDIYRTYIGIGQSRQEVTRRHKEDLIEYLYQYYKEQDICKQTVQQVFERCEQYRLDVLNRSPNTISRDKDTFYYFFEKDLYNRRITTISTDEIAEYFNRRTKELSLSDRALRDAKQVLGRIFKYAVQQEKLIKENPVELIDLENYFQNCVQNNKTDDEKLFTREEIGEIESEVRSRLDRDGYDGYLYAILLAILTGVRAGELPTLRWSDMTDNGLHIHTQQRIVRRKGEPRLLEELPFTKNERKHPKGGRYFPIWNEIQSLLDEIQTKQRALGISTEFIFCTTDGTWINKEMYEQRLRRLCKKLGYHITRNHAFRKSLNSFVFIPLGIPVTQRAYLLGHSVEVNERFYSFTRTECLNEVKEKLNMASIPAYSRKNVVPFHNKKIPRAQ